MRLRLTRQQREYQEFALQTAFLREEFKPSSRLCGELADALALERVEHKLQIDSLKSKSLWRIIRERYL